MMKRFIKNTSSPLLTSSTSSSSYYQESARIVNSTTFTFLYTHPTSNPHVPSGRSSSASQRQNVNRRDILQNIPSSSSIPSSSIKNPPRSPPRDINNLTSPSALKASSNGQPASDLINFPIPLSPATTSAYLPSSGVKLISSFPAIASTSVLENNCTQNSGKLNINHHHHHHFCQNHSIQCGQSSRTKSLLHRRYFSSSHHVDSTSEKSIEGGLRSKGGSSKWEECFQCALTQQISQQLTNQQQLKRNEGATSSGCSVASLLTNQQHDVTLTTQKNSVASPTEQPVGRVADTASAGTSAPRINSTLLPQSDEDRRIKERKDLEQRILTAANLYQLFELSCTSSTLSTAATLYTADKADSEPSPFLTYYIDEKELELSYKRLQKILHPDQHFGRSQSAEEMRSATELSAAINYAYQTLKSPVHRAEYLIWLLFRVNVFQESKTNHNANLMMEVFELRERISESFTANEIAAITAEIKDLISAVQEKFELAIQTYRSQLLASKVKGNESNEGTTAINLAIKLKYYFKMLEEIDEKS